MLHKEKNSKEIMLNLGKQPGWKDSIFLILFIWNILKSKFINTKSKSVATYGRDQRAPADRKQSLRDGEMCSATGVCDGCTTVYVYEWPLNGARTYNVWWAE